MKSKETETHASTQQEEATVTTTTTPSSLGKSLASLGIMTVEEIACEAGREPDEGTPYTYDDCLRFSPANSSDAVEISLSGKYSRLRAPPGGSF